MFDADGDCALGDLDDHGAPFAVFAIEKMQRIALGGAQHVRQMVAVHLVELDAGALPQRIFDIGAR